MCQNSSKRVNRTTGNSGRILILVFLAIRFVNLLGAMRMRKSSPYSLKLLRSLTIFNPYSRSFDIANERLPAYEPHPENYADESIPSPSLRLSHTRRGSTDLLLQRLEAEEEDDTDMKRIADILSRPKRHKRPHNALKRHETF